MTSVLSRDQSALLPGRLKRASLLPKSNVPRVVLHDNCSQQHLLDMTLSHLSVQQGRARRHLELRRRTFLTTQALKQEQLLARGIRHVTLVPNEVATAYSKMTRFYRHQVKSLPRAVNITDNHGEQEMQEVEEICNGEEKESHAQTPATIKSPSIIRLHPKVSPGCVHHFPRIHQQEGSLQRSGTIHNGCLPHTSTPGPLGRSSHPIMTPRKHRRYVRKAPAPSLLHDPRFTALQQQLQSPAPGSYVDGFLALSAAGDSILHSHRPAMVAWQRQGVMESLPERPQFQTNRRPSMFRPELNDSLTSLHFSTDSSSDEDEEDDTVNSRKINL